jgi:F0F1-type ATP synthase assembly protein I
MGTNGGLPPTVRLVGIGWYVAFCIVFGVGGGVLLDREFDTEPLLTLIGLALGLVAALWGGYRQLMDVLALISQRRAGRTKE